ncbi:putative ubiquitin carrier protein 4, partial [Trypanosoma cruzi]
VYNTSTMSADRSSRRKEMDFMKLMNGPRKVHPSNSVSEFWVEFNGPEGTAYEDGTWFIHVQLPADYPFKSPCIGFSNSIYHPNVDEASGSVCLDVINQTWTPMYELQNVFDVFLPQLLRYPNASDPLNSSAASKLLHDPIAYVSIVREHVSRHATREVALGSIPLEFRPLQEDAVRANEKTRTVLEDSSPATSKGLTEAPNSCVDSEEEYEPESIDI